MILDYKKSCFNYNKVVKNFKKVENNVEMGNSKKLCHLSIFFQKVSVHFQNLSILKNTRHLSINKNRERYFYFVHNVFERKELKWIG